MSQQTSGLAASIRSSVESTTFDLAGQNTNTITTNITNAFQEPFPISEMIRITFVTGAGKLARQKYDENAAKVLTTALRTLGFEEDRGASCVRECAGSFKLQHDTGKNLKTVVVFPRILDESVAQTPSNDPNGTSSSSSSSLFPKGSPKEMIALSSMSTFQNMIKSQCPTWSQKKACLAAIAEIKSITEEFEGKLLQGIPLSNAEQMLYDQVSVHDLEQKQTHVRDQMHQQVDQGKITAKEKKQLLDQVKERLDTIDNELAEAKKLNQVKKVEKLQALQEKALARSEKLTAISPIQSPPPLKHAAEIFQLKSKLKPLLELEESSRGRLLSVSETQSLAQKEDILQEISQLEEKSRGWFEDDEIFQVRLNACNASWEAQNNKSKKKSTPKTAGPAPSRTTNAWVTSGALKPKTSASKSLTATKKKPKSQGGGVFAAMMMDSDSD